MHQTGLKTHQLSHQSQKRQRRLLYEAQIFSSKMWHIFYKFAMVSVISCVIICRGNQKLNKLIKEHVLGSAADEFTKQMSFKKIKNIMNNFEQTLHQTARQQYCIHSEATVLQVHCRTNHSRRFLFFFTSAICKTTVCLNHLLSGVNCSYSGF